MNPYVSWALQGVILALGFYVFLRFLRTTRGGGLLRGLVLTLLFGVVGLWGLAEVAQFDELSLIFQKITPFLTVILAILFQPELRRAMAQLGEQNRLGRFLRSRRNEAVSEIAQAAVAMAGRRHGALIAFQREIGLDPYTQNAVKLDSEVNRLLLESVFHPGGALHDGAVVVIGDRIAAAACLFPLTESAELSKSTGTRHRAAIGVTEETDAVALVVSEETGGISICQRGLMERDVRPERLEALLRRRMGEVEEEQAEGAEAPALRQPSSLVRLTRTLRAGLTEDVPRKLAAVLLAAGVLFLAYREVVQTHRIPLHVVSGEQARRAQAESPWLLAVRLPDENLHQVQPRIGERLMVEVSGPRREIERIQAQLTGVLDIPPEQARTGVRELALGEVRWRSGDARVGPEVSFRWARDPPPRLELQRLASREIALRPEHVPVDASELDGYLEARVDQLDFRPSTVEVEGPEAAVAELGTGELPFKLSTLKIPPGERGPVASASLGLDDSLRQRGLALPEGTRVSVDLPIEPILLNLEPIEREVPVVDLRGGQAAERFSLPVTHQRVAFRIQTAGIFPAGVQSGPLYDQLYRTIRQFVQDELILFVDVSRLHEDAGLSTAPLQYHLPRDWKARLGRVLERELGAEADLRVELADESFREIRLDRVQAPPSDPEQLPSNGPGASDG